MAPDDVGYAVEQGGAVGKDAGLRQRDVNKCGKGGVVSCRDWLSHMGSGTSSKPTARLPDTRLSELKKPDCPAGGSHLSSCILSVFSLAVLPLACRSITASVLRESLSLGPLSP